MSYKKLKRKKLEIEIQNLLLQREGVIRKGKKLQKMNEISYKEFEMSSSSSSVQSDSDEFVSDIEEDMKHENFTSQLERSDIKDKKSNIEVKVQEELNTFNSPIFSNNLDQTSSMKTNEVSDKSNISSYTLYEYPHFPTHQNPKFIVKNNNMENGLGPKLSFGWAMCVYTTDKGQHKWVRKYCLGSYECKANGCKFTERPRNPRSRKRNFKFLLLPNISVQNILQRIWFINHVISS